MPRNPLKTKQPEIDPRSIDVTSEYDIFQRLPGNRALSENHIKQLMEAMREQDLFVPILVNQEFQVIDGQHRLEARKRLGLPVPFYWTEGLGLSQVQGLNSTQKGWRNEDFVDAYIELGNNEYRTYKWFRSKYGIPHEATVWLLTGSDMRKVRDRFQHGDFTVTDLEGGKRKAEMLQQIKPFFKHWKHGSFIKAFLIVLNREGFDFKTFMHRVKMNPTMLVPCPSIDGYLRLIEEVYNYRSPKKIPLRFGHDAQGVKLARV
jgi:hypothetical protein